MIKNYFILLRPHHYLKNLFIFLPLFFALKITDVHLLYYTCIAFIGFCLVTSGVYIFNDLCDIKEDKKHPLKKYRPITAGLISKRNAILIMILVFVMGVSISCLINRYVVFLFLVYITLNILYSIKLKHIAIIDIFIIGIDFVIRIYIGGISAGIFISHWIILMTFLLALFLALGKRRDDFLIFLKSGKKMRRIIDRYNLEFINISTAVIVSIIMVAYMMYTISPDVIAKMHSDKLYFTMFFVVLGLMRYLQLIYVEEKSGSPTLLLFKDKFLQFCIIGWSITFLILIYIIPRRIF